MPFTIDQDSLLIRGRRGDTASFTFNFNEDISDYTVHFYVKKSVTSSDSVIEKKYENSPTHAITVNLTTADTELLSAQANAYTAYYWGVKINKGTDFAQTIIPHQFKNPPMMYIYPEIGGV